METNRKSEVELELDRAMDEVFSNDNEKARKMRQVSIDLNNNFCESDYLPDDIDAATISKIVIGEDMTKEVIKEGKKERKEPVKPRIDTQDKKFVVSVREKYDMFKKYYPKRKLDDSVLPEPADAMPLTFKIGQKKPKIELVPTRIMKCCRCKLKCIVSLEHLALDTFEQPKSSTLHWYCFYCYKQNEVLYEYGATDINENNIPQEEFNEQNEMACKIIKSKYKYLLKKMERTELRPDKLSRIIEEKLETLIDIIKQRT